MNLNIPVCSKTILCIRWGQGMAAIAYNDNIESLKNFIERNK